MSRGRRSGRALEAAVPVARVRGEVMFLETQPGTCFDFLISGPAGTSAVRTDRALRIHGSPAELAAVYPDTLSRISAAALAPEISREFWLWSPWGTMRYFRIDGTAIIELDRLGNVRAPLVKGSLAGTVRPRYRTSRKKPGPPTARPGPEPHAERAALPPQPGPAVPGPAGSSVREPAPVRYLRCRNRENAAGGTGLTL